MEVSILRQFGNSILLLGFFNVALAAGPEFNVVTGSQTGTYIQIGKDLSTHVAEPVKLSMSALPSSGSVENIRRLRDEPGTRLAILQADVFQSFKEQANKGNAEALRVISPLRVVLPLYDEEIYAVVRADSPMFSIRDIENQRINIGPIGGGTAMTVANLYPLLFQTALPESKITTFRHEEAMLKLATNQGVDVVMIVAGQPAPLFLGIEPGAEKYFKLLKLSTSDPEVQAALAVYPPKPIQKSNYPLWLTQDIDAFSVKSMLVTYDYAQATTRKSLVIFAKSLCENLGHLKKNGHPKWEQVSTKLPALNLGWRYYPPTEEVFRRCEPPREKPLRICPLAEKIMGLCSNEPTVASP